MMYSKKFSCEFNLYSSENIANLSFENSIRSIKDIFALINICLSDKTKKKELINYVSTQRRINHNDTIDVIIPQYHTSKCVDNCAYCGFRKSNINVFRAELNDEDFEKELKLILEWGYTKIEFVYASDVNFPALRIAKRISQAKNIGKSIGKELEIGINAPPFSVDDYKILNYAGLDFVLLWMETYSENYKKWHPNNTPKSNFNYRIDTFDRSIQAGIKKYAFAVLFGLSNWVEDTIQLIAHGLYIRETYGIEPYIIGNPRLKYAMGLNVENSRFTIDDENYVFINYLFKLIFPESKLFINTRETLDINMELIKGGGDFFTIDCGTFPGAYLNAELIKNGQEQFHTSHYNREKTVALLQNKGYKVNF